MNSKTTLEQAAKPPTSGRGEAALALLLPDGLPGQVAFVFGAVLVWTVALPSRARLPGPLDWQQKCRTGSRKRRFSCIPTHTAGIARSALMSALLVSAGRSAHGA